MDGFHSQLDKNEERISELVDRSEENIRIKHEETKE